MSHGHDAGCHVVDLSVHLCILAWWLHAISNRRDCIVSSITTNKTDWRGVSLLKANILLPLFLFESVLNTFSLRSETWVYSARPPLVSLREQSSYNKFIVLYLSKDLVFIYLHIGLQVFDSLWFSLFFAKIAQELQKNLCSDKITLFPHSHLFHPLNLPPMLTSQANFACYALHTGCRHQSGLSI